MWEGTPGIDSLLRKLERRNEAPNEEARRPASDSEMPDLLANTGNPREIKSVRDAIGSLRREARALDGESDVADKSCKADI